MWKRADASQSVSVRQLAAFHTQGNPAFVRYYTIQSGSTQSGGARTGDGWS